MSERIISIGTDLAEISRMEAVCREPAFLRHVAVPREQEWLDSVGQRRGEALASLFAAKEAAVKALGTGFSGGITPLQVEITHNSLGAPALTFTGNALEKASQLGVCRSHLSLSHDGGMALAFVILTGEENA